MKPPDKLSLIVEGVTVFGSNFAREIGCKVFWDFLQTNLRDLMLTPLKCMMSFAANKINISATIHAITYISPKSGNNGSFFGVVLLF